MTGETKRIAVVYRAESAVRLPQGKSFIFTSGRPDNGEPLVASIQTLHEDRNFGSPLPTDLEIVLSAPGESIDDVLNNCGIVPNHICTILAVCANAPIKNPVIDVAFDFTPEGDEREILEFLPSSRTVHPATSKVYREIDPSDVVAFFDGAHQTILKQVGLGNAMTQYALALNYFSPGNLILCASHLYMACEGIAHHIIETETGGDKDMKKKLAESLGMDTGPKNKDWSRSLKGVLVRDRVFDGDNELRKQVRLLSDGLEHGFGNLVEIRLTANNLGRRLLDQVRSKIIQYLPLEEELGTRLRQLFAVDYDGPASYARATIRGPLTADAGLAAPDQQHPRVGAHIEPKDYALNDGIWEVYYQTSNSAQLAEGLTLENVRFGSYAGLNDPSQMGFRLVDPPPKA